MFVNREEAGELLAQSLQEYRDRDNAVVFAIPRGGVVVGNKIAKILHLPLKVIVVRKLGAPANPELAIGAVAPEGIQVIDEDLVFRLGVGKKYLDEEIKRKRRELQERMERFGIKNLELTIKNKKIMILVDDGVATGATTLAAIRYLKYLKLRTNLPVGKAGNLELKTILAVPVIAKDTYNRLQSEVDKIVALEIPESFGAVGEFYREFPQVDDEEVKNILSDSRPVDSPLASAKNVEATELCTFRGWKPPTRGKSSSG